ncbi:66-kDa stress protein p66 [Syncephalis fuscata]|nr:66-kDa stress protein p66 [Syncephalis fuscata]
MSFTKQKVFSALPATERGRAVLLGGDPKEGRRVVYCNGRTIILRDLAYAGHSFTTTTARISPTGYYVASSDIRGTVRIWDATQPEQILKSEFHILGGKINDLSWDGDSQRIIAVGEGRERFGHAFTFDSGNSVGEIIGHNKPINSCHIRSNRPYRAVTAGDDNIVCFFHGPPFRFQFSIKDHSRFVNCVRFSPNGDHFASVSADTKMFLYDGKSGERVSEMSSSTNEGGHTGGIYSLAWSPDSTQILTSSADGSTKIWDVATGKVATTFKFAEQANVGHQQVGNLWQGDHLVSLSLSGDLNCLDPRAPEKPSRIVNGHQCAITGLAVQGEKTMWSSSYDGRWDVSTGETSIIANDKPISSTIGLVRDPTVDRIYTTGLDEQLRAIPNGSQSFAEKTVSVGGAPKQICVNAGGIVAVTTMQGSVVVLRGENEVIDKLEDPKITAVSAAITSDGARLAVGSQDNQIQEYALSNNKVQWDTPVAVYSNRRAAATVLVYSTDGKSLVAGDSQGKLIATLTQWASHTARITSIAWSPSGKYVASGALDTNVYIWSVDAPSKRIAILGAHTDEVSSVQFIDNDTLATAGRDGAIKIWQLKHHN